MVQWMAGSKTRTVLNSLIADISLPMQTFQCRCKNTALHFSLNCHWQQKQTRSVTYRMTVSTLHQETNFTTMTTEHFRLMKMHAMVAAYCCQQSVGQRICWFKQELYLLFLCGGYLGTAMTCPLFGCCHFWQLLQWPRVWWHSALTTYTGICQWRF